MIDALPLLLSDEGYQISRSVRLRGSASAYFSATLGSGNKRTFTYSLWLKRGTLGVAQTLLGTNSGTAALPRLYFTAADQLEWFSRDSSSVIQSQITTTAVYRDPSAWYHIVFVYDTTQAVAADRLSIYVNGVLQAVTITTALALNEEPNSTFPYGDALIGIYRTTAFALPFDGYLTEINFIDGQARTPASFGETNPVTGVWQPKRYTGTYGTNGFYLNFSDNSAATAAAIGKDYSGNGNNWTPNNISVTAGTTYDSMLDVPTQWSDGGNGRGNYAVVNPLSGAGTALSVTAGNLNFNQGSSLYGLNVCSMSIRTKTYFEITLGSSATGAGRNSYCGVGSSGSANAYSTSGFFGTDSSAWSLGYSNTTAYTSNNNSQTTQSGTVANGDVFMYAVDPENGRIWFGRNGTWYAGDPAAGTGASYTNLPSEVFPVVQAYNSGTHSINFGQRPFSYTPPSGFKALNTLNLP